MRAGQQQDGQNDRRRRGPGAAEGGGSAEAAVVLKGGEQKKTKNPNNTLRVDAVYSPFETRKRGCCWRSAAGDARLGVTQEEPPPSATT